MTFKRIDVRWLFGSVFVTFFIFQVTNYFLPFYVYSDPYWYAKFYGEVSGVSFAEVIPLAKLSIGATEPVYPFISWFFSGFLSRESFVFLSNALFVFSFFCVCRKYGASIVVVVVLMLTNFYFYVLYLSAERLKFAVCFMFLAMSFNGGVRSFFLSVVSILAHAQLILFYLGIVLAKSKKFFFDGKPRFLKLIISAIIVAAAVFLLRGHVAEKLSFYYRSDIDFSGLFKVVLFVIVAYFYSGRRGEVLVISLPLVLAVCVLGGERVVVMSFLLFLFYALQYKKGLNLGVLVFGSYFGIKTIQFLSNVIDYGNGFFVK